MFNSILVRFQKSRKLASLSGLQGTPSSLALIRRQFVQVVSAGPSRLSQEVVIAEEVVLVVCHLALVLHEPLLVPLLHGPKEVSPRLTSLTPSLSSWSMEL